jgi:hypothetical protein
MDFQKMLDTISETASAARKPCHLSLGALHDLCAEHPHAMVIVDGDGGLSAESSYRGYYDEIAFTPVSNPTSAKHVLTACRRGLSATYEGYKGGDYRYDRSTSTWLACYGSCGPAIVSGEYRDGAIHLTTRETD